MSRETYQEAMRRRHKRLGRRVHQCAYNHLHGACLRIEQLAEFAECVDALGGDWLAFVCAANPTEALFLATVDFCDRGSCTTDHRAAAKSLVAYLFELLSNCPSQINVRHSPAWAIPELTKAA